MAGQGYSTIGDVHTTKNGVEWNTIWAEFQQTLQLVNTQRMAIMQLFTSSIAVSEINVEQSSEGGADFEVASEFGVPKSVRVSPTLLEMGFPFRWYDQRKSWTWRYLAEVESGQIEQSTRPFWNQTIGCCFVT